MATLFKPLDEAETARVDLERWIGATQSKSLLRFITCGSVDDGKSTLIGRLLYDSKMLFDDQMATLESDSRKVGTQGDDLDFALLVDGLSAEREQGITIDVAYRFFATDRRKFIVADTPGHEQYTRNMVTGASTADLAVILIDARKGVLTQTRRHSFLVNLIGIRNIVLAVNKMDLVGYDRSTFDAIVHDYAAFAAEVGIETFTAIPVSGLKGDNITSRSIRMDWYDGASLIEHLEAVPSAVSSPESRPFRMAVQWVNRPNQDFRGYAGRISSGRIQVGQRIAVAPSGQHSTVKRIVTTDGDLHQAIAGQSVTLTLEEEIDCSRGDVLVSAADTPRAVNRIGASLVWMSDEPLVPRRSYLLKVGARTLSAEVSTVKSVIDVNTLERQSGKPLSLNDIGRVEIGLDRSIPALTYAEDRKLGAFILIDKMSHATVAAGLIEDFPTAPLQPHRKATARDTIAWVAGPDANIWAETERARLRAQGWPVAILDDRALAAFPPGDPVQTATAAAMLLADNGVQVLVTATLPDAPVSIGRTINTNQHNEGGDEWII